MILKSGIDATLEEEADRLLAEDRRARGVTRHSDMQDYFSEGQLYRRTSREVITSAGVPDASLYCGIFKRTYCPPRDGVPRDLREGGVLD